MADEDIVSQYRQVLASVPLPRTPRDFNDKRPSAARLFSTNLYERREQFAVYRSRCSSMWEAELPAGVSAAAGFPAEYMTCNLGEIILNSGWVSPHTRTRLSGRSRRSPLDHWWLVRSRSGEAWFEAGDRQIHASNYDALSLALPRAAFAAVADRLDTLCMTILAGNLTGLLADHLSSLERRLAGMSAEEIVAAGGATVEMISAYVQPSPDRLHEARPAIEAVLFERARAYIEADLGNPELTPELLMQTLCVSRSNLYRTFEHVGGISRFIQRCRLLAARDALVAGRGGRVQDLAYRYGFTRGSDFARAFRREFGMSPREIRDVERK
jgi:AraC-like DNA-binding protein